MKQVNGSLEYLVFKALDSRRRGQAQACRKYWLAAESALAVEGLRGGEAQNRMDFVKSLMQQIIKEFSID